MPAQITLSVVKGEQTGQEFVFDERNSCIIGRAKDCRPKLPATKENRRISRHHCLLDINPPDIRIRDFGSLNGTFVNGEKIGSREKGQTPEEGAQRQFPEYDLTDGDEIQLGEMVLRVAVFVPAVCSECAREISEDQKSQTLLAPGVHLCRQCRQEAQEQKRKVAKTPKTRRCAKCGRSIVGEVNEHRQGHYTCHACRKNPLDIIKRLLDLAKAGRKELGPIRGYTIEKELGRGGFGAVYLARRDGSDQPVALKLMLPEVAADQRASEMFCREIENTQALSHPNVVQVRHAGSSDGTFFFTLEFCNSGDLDGLMKKRGGTLTPDVAVPLMLQVLDGLEYAHQAPIPNVRLKDGTYKEGKGLVHRDLKSPNILLHSVGGDLVAKVSDFGLSKAFDTAGLSGQTRSGTLMGTPVFMPRIQVRRFKYAKPDVDVWGRGSYAVLPTNGPPDKRLQPGRQSRHLAANPGAGKHPDSKAKSCYSQEIGRCH